MKDMEFYETYYPNNAYVKLINADCFDYLKSTNEKFDVVFTSPPYNRKRNDKYSEYNDTLDDYFEFLTKIVESLEAKVNKYIFINVQTNYYQKADVYKFIGKYAEKIQQFFVWGKTNPMPANGFNITNSYEFIIVLGNHALKSNTTYTKNLLTTSVNSETTSKDHKAIMKQEVSDFFIEHFTSENDLIYDPFMGLATTAVSCKKFGRKCVGTEISKKYYLESIGRVEAFQLSHE